LKSQNRVKVGLFVTLSFFVLTGAIGWLAGSRFFREVDSYYVHFARSVSGLLPGARVEYQGVTVGRVMRMRLTNEAPPQVVVQVDLKPGTPIRHDTYAMLRGSLVTGIRYIELGGGTKDSPALAEGDTIAVKDEESIEDIAGRAGEASQLALVIMRRVDKDVLTQQNIAAISAIIQNIAAVTGELRTVVAAVATPQNQAALKTMISDLSVTTAALRHSGATAGQTLDQLRAEVPGLTGSAKGALSEAQLTMADLHKTVLATQQVVGQVNGLLQHVDGILYQNQGELAVTLSGLSGSLRELNETLALIRYDPARLVWGSNLPTKKIPDK
jgi:phospholipid/cholesterol/gamma-HCH transport system substrate-binding protein